MSQFNLMLFPGDIISIKAKTGEGLKGGILGYINYTKHNNLITPTKKEVENVYTQLDKDKNGKVDFEEFKVFFMKFLEMQYCS